MITSLLIAAVINVSSDHPRYFETADGKPWIPIGCNICFDRVPRVGEGAVDHAAVRAHMERWLSDFADNGGNCVRLWAGHRSLEVMPEKPGEYDAEASETMRRILRLAEQKGLKLKVTLESFRSCLPDGSKAWQPNFNRRAYAPYAKAMGEFYASEKCRAFYLGKADYLASLGYADSPAVYCWELWNEINATAPMRDYAPWSDSMLAELKRRFPRQLTVQNLGSFSDPAAYQQYDQMATVKGNDFMQVHRYIDPGAQLDACRAPMDVVCASAVREMLDRRGDCPAVLAEVGAVKANHTGMSPIHVADREGALLHDMLFAPFFAGAAGTGQSWWWGEYVAANNLWHHFRRFAKAIEGLDPVAERFRPFYTETPRLRVYGLKGLKTIVVWCRDKRNGWEDEFVRGFRPETITDEILPFWGCSCDCYLPWEDRRVTVDTSCLPPFRRSIVVRIPADAVDGLVRPH